MATYKAQQYAPSNSVIELAQITASTGGSDIIKMISDDGKIIWKSALFAVTIAAINTNVVVKLEGSLDGDNWWNLDTDELTITYTANGTYGIRYEGEGEAIYIRLYKVSESGGTAVTIDTKVKVFNPYEGIIG